MYHKIYISAIYSLSKSNSQPTLFTPFQFNHTWVARDTETNITQHIGLYGFVATYKHYFHAKLIFDSIHVIEKIPIQYICSYTTSEHTNIFVVLAYCVIWWYSHLVFGCKRCEQNCDSFEFDMNRMPNKCVKW